MKMTLTKALKRVAFTVSLLFLAFFIYANLEPAPMHAYVKPIKMAIFKVDGLTDANQVSDISKRVSQLIGVTACAANPVSELVSITFDPDQTSETVLQQMVGNITRKTVQTAVFKSDGPEAPQCPVPQEYVMAFEKAKYALCFR